MVSAAPILLAEQARDWLKAKPAAWSRVLESGPEQMSAVVSQMLNHWIVDAALGGIRDDIESARLREAERAAFEQLWKDGNHPVPKERTLKRNGLTVPPECAWNPQHTTILTYVENDVRFLRRSFGWGNCR
jgi:hypothetical protein